MNKIPMTVTGHEQLKLELDKLKNEDRPKVIAAISEARAHGDLKENAEYHAAREQQGFVEARIRDLEYKLSHVQVIDITKMENTGRVIFGATVTIVDEDSDDDAELCYCIVGEDEADFKVGKISVSSPLARALVGKQEGDIAEFTSPQGDKAYEIIKVEYI